MKKILSIVFIGFAVGTLRADLSSQYLYWNVTGLADESGEPGGMFSYAQLKYTLTDGGDVFSLGNIVVADGVDGSSVTRGVATSPSFVELAGGATWSDYSFLAEVFDESGNSLGVSSLVAYNELVAGSLYENMSAAGGNAVISQGFFAVPEPTSGLLFILGLASLALKRKRV